MSQQISGLPCGKILGTLADGVTPIRCILDAGHDEPRVLRVAPNVWLHPS